MSGSRTAGSGGAQALIVDLLILGGLAAQGAGLYMTCGLGVALAVVGTEMAALGVVGATRA